MAYFPNGTAGDVLEQQCETCLQGVNDELLCPVYLVQLQYNYEQSGNKQLEACLQDLIDQAGTCQMKQAIQKAGVVFDFSSRDQMALEI